MAPLQAFLPCAPFLTSACVSPMWNTWYRVVVNKQIKPSQVSLVIASPSVVLTLCSQVVIHHWRARSSLVGLNSLQKCAIRFGSRHKMYFCYHRISRSAGLCVGGTVCLGSRQCNIKLGPTKARWQVWEVCPQAYETAELGQ